MSTHNLHFEQKYEKYQKFIWKLSVLVVKVSVYLNRCVFVMGGHGTFASFGQANIRRLSGTRQQMIGVVRWLLANDQLTKGHCPTSLVTVAWLSPDVWPSVHQFLGAQDILKSADCQPVVARWSTDSCLMPYWSLNSQNHWLTKEKL